MFCQSCRMNKCVRYSGSFCKTAKSRGFTLIELMIVMFIVVIVTAIAVPSYSAQVQKTRRVEGVSALLELAILMERYYANNGTYLAATATALTGSSSSENGFYGLTINPLVAESYTLLAAPANVQVGDDCGTFSLDSLGSQSVTGGSLPVDDCWRK